MAKGYPEVTITGPRQSGKTTLARALFPRDVGVSVPTVVRWLNVLEASFIIFRLRPYYNNFGKRQTKSSKIYFTETGLVSYLLGIRDASQFYSHPLVGNIFENMVVVEAVKHRLNQGLEPDCWFYQTLHDRWWSIPVKPMPTSPSISPTCRTGADDEEGAGSK